MNDPYTPPKGYVLIKRTDLKSIRKTLDAYANKQTARRMTQTCGTGKNERPFIDNPQAGQHYPWVQSALSTLDKALA